jgi:hypothetical protein
LAEALRVIGAGDNSTRGIAMPETYMDIEDDELDDIDNVSQPLNNGATPCRC